MNPFKNNLVLGVIFIALIASGMYVTYGMFNKQFTSYDEVELTTSKIGLQLPERADVKVRGVFVGEVLSYEPTDEGDGATVTLGLYQDREAAIPANVTGSILPKTLFGEKYVALVPPDQPSGELQAGDTIDQTEVSTEVEQVLSDLYPLLRAVQPAELNMTLNAIATALEGRGDQLGDNLETLDSYLRRFNPELPALIEDLRLTAEVSDTYADVLPEISTILRNTITTTGTLEGREAKLQALLSDVSQFSAVAERFTRNNGDNIVRLGEVSVPQLRLLARYAPEYPCLLGGLVGGGALQAEAFRGFTLHIVLEILPNQPRGYTAQDVPRYGEDRGPYCGKLPNPPWNQDNPVTRLPDFDDGIDEPTNKGTSRAPVGWSGTGAGYPGSPQESALLKGLLAPGMGTTAEDVPDLGAVLLGPMARGARVGFR